MNAFSTFGEINLVNGRMINNFIIKDSDVLLTRSITNVTEELLNNTKVKFVGTATTGSDHIDKNLLENKGIHFSDAKGCNAFAVAEYVTSAITCYVSQNNLSFKNLSIGIVGFGNIGKIVNRIFSKLGCSILLCDPPLQENGSREDFHDLDEVLKCDIISFHVPLITEGKYKTVHLLNKNNINLIDSGSMLINTSRGSVIDNYELLEILKKKNIYTVLDVWENEPSINIDLLKIVQIATPHIAGYTYEGKINGTVMIYEKLCDYLSLPKNWRPKIDSLKDNKIHIDFSSTETIMSSIFPSCYNIKKDDALLRDYFTFSDKNISNFFDYLRKSYTLRRELNNFSTSCKVPQLNDLLNILRIQVVND